MGVEAILVIAMFASFMVLLLLGFPVAWSLAGIGLVFAIVRLEVRLNNVRLKAPACVNVTFSRFGGS